RELGIRAAAAVRTHPPSGPDHLRIVVPADAGPAFARRHRRAGTGARDPPQVAVPERLQLSPVARRETRVPSGARLVPFVQTSAPDAAADSARSARREAVAVAVVSPGPGIDWRSMLLLAPALALLALFVASVAQMVALSFGDGEGFGLQHYRAFFARPDY